MQPRVGKACSELRETAAQQLSALASGLRSSIAQFSTD